MKRGEIIIYTAVRIAASSIINGFIMIKQGSCRKSSRGRKFCAVSTAINVINYANILEEKIKTEILKMHA